MYTVPPHVVSSSVGGQYPGQSGGELRIKADNTINEQKIRHIIDNAVKSCNSELKLRQSVMSSLIEEKVNAKQRREVLRRALTEYERLNPKPAKNEKIKFVLKSGATLSTSGDDTMPNLPKPSLPTDDAAGSLVAKIKAMLQEHDHVGLPVHKLGEHVLKHGATKVLQALKNIDGLMVNSNRLMIKRTKDSGNKSEKSEKSLARAGTTVQMSSELQKAEKEQMPTGGTAAGGADDPRADPVGARKLWNKRIVEKMPDGKWHVVGHVAGLEDPKTVPQLDTGLLDREHLLILLRQLLKIHQIEQGNDAKSRKKNSSKKS